MGKIESDTYRYSITVVTIFGILGNILVILSILRQKKSVVKNNYYFLVLHLAICDLVVLFFYLFMITCPINVIGAVFQLTGVGMMLTISLLRYRAAVHPLKPAISGRKLKVVCALVYLVALIVAVGIHMPPCLIKSFVVRVTYSKFHFASGIFFVYFGSTIFMAVVYYKISRSLIKQNKHMKSVCSNVVRQRTPDSSLNILKYIRNRRTFLVCLSTVLCYGIAHLPESVHFIWFITDENHLRMKYFSVW